MNASWVKSSRSFSNGNCVEVANLPGGEIGVRNSRDPDGPVLRFTPDGWRAFLGGVRNGDPTGSAGLRAHRRRPGAQPRPAPGTSRPPCRIRRGGSRCQAGDPETLAAVLRRQRVHLLTELRSLAGARAAASGSPLVALLVKAAELHVRADLGVVDAAEHDLSQDALAALRLPSAPASTPSARSDPA